MFWRAYRLWDRNDCLDLSAAFAYHSLQSFFPLLLISLGIASRILGRDDGLTERILDWATQILPESAVPFVRATLLKLYRQGAGAGVVGLGFLLVTSSNAYLTLQRGADRLWGFRLSANQQVSMRRSVENFLRVRLEAIVLMTAIGVFIVVDQLTTTLPMLDPGSWRAWLLQVLPSPFSLFLPVSRLADLLVSLASSCLLAFALLRLLPSRAVPVGPLIPGAILIGSAMSGLSWVLGRSLISLGSRYQAYGVIGGVLVLTLWVWVFGLIIYYGIALSVLLGRPSVQGGRSAPTNLDSSPSEQSR